jgi:L-amino acid N-acyltransferase YncA
MAWRGPGSISTLDIPRMLEPIVGAQAIGGIGAVNAASIPCHERLGFMPVAHFRDAGRKFDRRTSFSCNVF